MILASRRQMIRAVSARYALADKTRKGKILVLIGMAYVFANRTGLHRSQANLSNG